MQSVIVDTLSEFVANDIELELESQELTGVCVGVRY